MFIRQKRRKGLEAKGILKGGWKECQVEEQRDEYSGVERTQGFVRNNLER